MLQGHPKYVEKLHFKQGENFEPIDLSKNTGTNNSVICQNSCEVDTAAQKYGGLSTI